MHAALLWSPIGAVAWGRLFSFFFLAFALAVRFVGHPMTSKGCYAGLFRTEQALT